MARKQRLSDVKLDEISFVGKGDNPEAHVLLLKMKPEESFTPHNIVKLGKDYSGRDKDLILKGWMEANPDRVKKDGDALTFDQINANREIKDKVWGMVWTLEDSISSIMCDESVTDKAKMIQQSVDEFKAAITPITKEEVNMPELKKAKEDLAKAQEMIETLEKDKGALTEEVTTLKAACSDKDKKMKDMEETMKKGEGEDPIYKGVPEPFVKQMKEDRARIAKMEEDNLNREYISKAAPLSLVGKAEDIGPLLKTIAKSSPETAESVLTILKAANERIKEGDLLKENGTGGGESAGTTALDKLNKKAEEYRKEHQDVSIHKAFTIVFDDPANADLKKQYEEERAA